MQSESVELAESLKYKHFSFLKSEKHFLNMYSN